MRSILNLLSLPFLWAGQLAAAFKLPLAVPLLKIAFGVSGNGTTGRAALITSYKVQGRDAARAQAAAWMRSRPRVEVAAFAGLVALEGADLATARQMLEWGRAHGDDRQGLLDILEYGVTVPGHDAAATADMLSRFQARRDLPAELSFLLGKHLLLNALWRKDLAQARGRAQHLLAVQNVPEAELVLWALAKREGKAAEAQARIARAKLKPDFKLYYQALCERAVGNDAGVLEVLGQLRELNAEAADRLQKDLQPGGVA